MISIYANNYSVSNNQPQGLRVTKHDMGLSPKPPPMLTNTSADMWTKRLSCHADLQSAGVTPEVNLRNRTQARKSASENSTLALKPRADITRSPQQGYQWPQEKDLCPPKIKKKIIVTNLDCGGCTSRLRFLPEALHSWL